MTGKNGRLLSRSVPQELPERGRAAKRIGGATTGSALMPGQCAQASGALIDIGYSCQFRSQHLALVVVQTSHQIQYRGQPIQARYARKCFQYRVGSRIPHQPLEGGAPWLGGGGNGGKAANIRLAARQLRNDVLLSERQTAKVLQHAGSLSFAHMLERLVERITKPHGLKTIISKSGGQALHSLKKYRPAFSGHLHKPLDRS